jgi:hypothetical protein
MLHITKKMYILSSEINRRTYMKSSCYYLGCLLALGWATNLSLEASEPRLFSIDNFPPFVGEERERNIFFQKNIDLSERETGLIEHVKNSIIRSAEEISQLDNDCLLIGGMSSARGRHLLNNLCSLPQTNYLEIGCWKGSTFISALHNNQSSIRSAIAIDNWSEFNGPLSEFQDNCARFLPQDSYSYHFYSQDCFTIDPKTLLIQGDTIDPNTPSTQLINIYFYDGNHSELSQELAFTYYNEILDDVFIAVVDDWSVSSVQEGTLKAFKELNYEILFEGDLVGFRYPDRFWWNGMYVAVIRKSNDQATSPAGGGSIQKLIKTIENSTQFSVVE